MPADDQNSRISGRRESGGQPRRPIQWAGRRSGYRPDIGRVRGVYWLAAFMISVILFGAAPAVGHLNLSQAPAWARGLLLLAALELVYVAWIVSVPDWGTVRVGMAVFAVVAALYGAIAAIVLATPLTESLPLGLDDVRRTAAGWCGAAVLLAGLVTYLCGRMSGRWRAAMRRGS